MASAAATVQPDTLLLELSRVKTLRDSRVASARSDAAMAGVEMTAAHVSDCFETVPYHQQCAKAAVETESVQAATTARAMLDGEVPGAMSVRWLSVSCAKYQRFASRHVPMVNARRRTRAHATSIGVETCATDVVTDGRPTTATQVWHQ